MSYCAGDIYVNTEACSDDVDVLRCVYLTLHGQISSATMFILLASCRFINIKKPSEGVRQNISKPWLGTQKHSQVLRY